MLPPRLQLFLHLLALPLQVPRPAPTIPLVQLLCRLLIERFGFQTTFLITAGMKLAAFVPLFFLLRYVSDGWLAGGRRDVAAERAGYDVVPENAADAEAAAAAEAADGAAEGMQRAGGASAGQGLPPPQRQQQQQRSPVQPGGSGHDAELTAPLLGGGGGG